MGKKSSPAPPPAPDPFEIARADAEFNRINQFTPFGNLQFLGPNRNTAQLTLTPELQQNIDLRLQSDSNLLQEALARQGLLDTQPIDLSQFGDIQSALDLSNVNFGGVDPASLTAPNLIGNIQNPFSIQGNLNVGDLPEIPQNIEQFRTDVEDAIFNRGRRLLDPVFQDQERAQIQRLANRGLPESGEAFDTARTRFFDRRNRAFVDLADAATVAGGNAASQQLGNILGARGAGFNEALAGGSFANQAAQQGLGQALAQAGFANQAGLLGLGANLDIQNQGLRNAAFNNQASAQNLALQQQLLQNNNAARAQALAEAQGIRGNQFNELASLLGLQQVQAPGINSFFAPSQAPVMDAFALNQNAQNLAYQGALQNQQGMLGGLFGLGGALLGGPIGGAIGSSLGDIFSGGGGGNTRGGRSDRRLKHNIRRIGTVKGYPWYSFDYLWGESSQGVMSDEIPSQYVHQHLGFDWVDYGALLNG